jgi:hypothetical protein
MDIFSLGEDTERSVSCTKHARRLVFQKANRRNRLFGMPIDWSGNFCSKPKHLPLLGDYFDRNEDAT